MRLKPKSSREEPLLMDNSGYSDCILGNEAIVRGALEAGVGFACGYPGTPSSEVTDTFARIAPARGIVFEYSVNEKVALEMAFAASLAGARSICAMKHLGLLVAGDPLSTIPYIGVESGMVIVSAGDPGCGTSPNEQDQRLLGPMLHIPVLDPGTPQEAHDMALFAFELSEVSRLPVILRATTHVCHTRAAVEFGHLSDPVTKGFVRDPRRHVPIPANARRMRVELTERLERARELVSSSGFFRRSGSGDVVVLSAGAPAAVCSDLIEKYGLMDQVTLWSLGTVYPLPQAELIEALRGVKTMLVVEELAPFLEDALQLLCARNGLSTEILGKHTGHLPTMFNFTPEIVADALRDGLGLELPAEGTGKEPLPVPPRPPTLCAGCPHRAAFFAARSAFDDDQLYFNDIGCYSLGYGPPLQTADALLCMGAGFTLAAGVSRMTGKRTVGFMGDSTFFHAGMPPLLNAVKEGVNMVAVILDNRVTAMTGFQESAGRVPEHTVSVEEVVRSLGVEQVEKVDPFKTSEAVAAFRRARDGRGVSVVIVEQGCPVHEVKEGRLSQGTLLYEVDQALCRACGQANTSLRCSQKTTGGYERQLTRGRLARNESCGPDVSSCSERCPLSLCIQGYAGHIAGGEYAEAFGHIMSRTLLPETVCRVCHTPCEDACVRGSADGAVAINALKRFVVSWAARQESDPWQPEREEDNGMLVAVIGAGPSGLSAAHDLGLRGYAVTILDAAERAGGILAHGIPEYRLPPDALQRDMARILRQGVSFRGGTRLGSDIHLDRLVDGEFDAVYLAMGASRALSIDIPGAGMEKAPSVATALEYLRGTSPVPDDGAGLNVVIVGGGNAAIDASRTAIRRGARRVSVVCVEDLDEMPAIRQEIRAAVEEGIELHPGMRPDKLVSGGIVFVRMGENTDPGMELEAELVILAIGQRADIEGVIPSALAIELTPDGHIKIDPDTGATSHPRIFAGGDLVGGEQTVTGALADGLRAAWGIDTMLRGREKADRRPPPRHAIGAVDLPEPLSTREWAEVGRRTPGELPPKNRVGSFEEVVKVFGESDARAEASRCLMCGHCGNCRACIDLFGCPAILEDEEGRVIIDPILCTGCGVCAELCPNGAFKVVGDG